MGLFDLFRGSSKSSDERKEARASKEVAKWAERAADKRAQNYDRQEALSALADMGSGDAAAALLKRFSFTIDPSITDQEEKDLASKGILAAGEEAVDPIREYAARAESLAWPMKILKQIVDEETYVGELVEWLDRWDTEYSKFVDPKIQLLIALEEYKDERILEAVEPFLQDVNETARFHAVATSFAQDDDSAIGALCDALIEEESFRVKNRILDGFAQRGWKVPEERLDAVRGVLPPAFALGSDGDVTRRGD